MTHVVCAAGAASVDVGASVVVEEGDTGLAPTAAFVVDEAGTVVTPEAGTVLTGASTTLNAGPAKRGGGTHGNVPVSGDEATGKKTPLPRRSSMVVQRVRVLFGLGSVVM